VSRLDLFRFVLISRAGWMNHRQQHAIDCLREENRVLREQLGSRRLRFNRSAYAFRVGDRGGNFTDSTPGSCAASKKAAGNG
jgi:hypothetical protein